MLIPIYVVGNTLQMPLFWFNSFLCIRAKTKLVPQPKEFLVGKKKGRIFANIFKGLRKRAHLKLRERREWDKTEWMDI